MNLESLPGKSKEMHLFLKEELDEFDTLSTPTPYLKSKEIYDIFLDDFKKYSEDVTGKSLYENKGSVIFTTIETYPIIKLKALKAFLEDLLFELSAEDDSLHYIKYKRYLNVINHIFTPLSAEEILFYEREYIHRKMSYLYNSAQDIGRLYPSGSSLQYFNREIRYYLFNEYYEDVDLQNAHPTILLHYALSAGIKTPLLQEYIDNRNDFIEKINSEKNENFNVEDFDKIKQEILSTINKVIYDGDSKKLSLLHLEILTIRNSIWDNFFIKQNKSINLASLAENETFRTKTKNKQKVTVQSLYCFSMESTLLIDLHSFLEKELLMTCNNLMSSDDKIDLRFIPFFDGAYIRIEKPAGFALKALIDKYNNNKESIFKFALKPIRPNWDKLSLTILEKYENLTTFLLNLSSRDYKKLLNSIDYGTFKLSDELQSDLISTHNDYSIKCKERALLIKDLKTLRKNVIKEYRVWVKLHGCNPVDIRKDDVVYKKDFSFSHDKQKFLDDIVARFSEIDLALKTQLDSKQSNKVAYNYERITEESRRHEYGLRKKLLKNSASLTHLTSLIQD